MADAPREVWVTGLGIVSCLGEGVDAHWQGLAEQRITVDAERFKPYLVHPLAPLDLDKQIPKKGDQRQMEAWQRIGTYAAGLALDQAGVKGDTALLERMDMIVAAGGGERDYAADEALLSGLGHADNPEAMLNERLMADLRPTLFLAQLSNLLAGNISVVHGVVGSSRTFMGEESAGTDAVRTACARIASRQGEIFLVGGSYNAERPDVLLEYEMAGLPLKGEYAPVWERQARGGGLVIGSLGCFLVIESREHAARRGARGWARIVSVATDPAFPDPRVTRPPTPPPPPVTPTPLPTPTPRRATPIPVQPPPQSVYTSPPLPIPLVSHEPGAVETESPTVPPAPGP